MKKIAHRGYKTKFIKENTIEAFDNALNNEFTGFECDVRKTKDGVLVVLHDALIDRTSNGHGFVRDKTYEELLKYNFGSKEFPSKIPTLKSVLLRYKGTLKLIELKCDVDLEPFLDLIDDDVYFISFDTTLILKIKKKYPKLKVGVLNYVLNSVEVDKLDALCILDMVADDHIVLNLLERGKKVFIYGTGEKIDYKRDYENLYYIVNDKL